MSTLKPTLKPTPNIERWTGARAIRSAVVLGQLCIFASACAVDDDPSAEGDTIGGADERSPDLRALEGQSDYAEHPPRAESMSLEFIEPGSENNARLEVQYPAGEVTGDELLVELEGGEVILRDTGKAGDLKGGDGVYSAIVSFDIAAEAERRIAFLERVDGEATITEFHGRTAIRTDLFSPEKLNFLLDGESIPPQELQPEEVLGSRLALPAAMPPPLPVTIDPEKTLSIRDLSVTRDPSRTGVWTNGGGSCKFTGDAYGAHGFSHLMQEMAVGAGMSTEAWTQDWLRTWEFPQVINGDTNDLGFMGLSEVWNRFSFTADDGDPHEFSDTLDMSRPPFQLIAIVNRVDLHEAGVFGGAGGEVRLVFQMVDTTPGGDCKPLDMTVIFEYAVPRHGCTQTKAWATDWYNLDNLTLGTPAYNNALEALTQAAVLNGADPNHVTGSALAQLRVNSRMLSWPHYPTFQWHMQEFVNSGSGLSAVPIAMTPNHRYEMPDIVDSSQPIDDFINVYAGSITAGNYTVGLSHPVTHLPFQAGFAPYGHVAHNHPSPYNFSDLSYVDPFASAAGLTPGPGAWVMERNRYWGSHHSDTAARHEFSLNTCNGCHGREVFDDANAYYQDSITYGTDDRSVPGASFEQPFLHIRARDPLDQGPAIFSRFLTGTDDGCTTPTGLAPPLGTEVCTASCCPIGDPANGHDVAQYHYDELERRGQELESIVNSSCLMQIAAAQVEMYTVAPH